MMIKIILFLRALSVFAIRLALISFRFKRTSSLTYLKSLRRKKKSNKLFILGAGPSIQQLNQRQFNDIKRNCSIGINSFTMHDFTPDFYSLEYKRFDGSNEKIIFLLDAVQKKSAVTTTTKVLLYLNGNTLTTNSLNDLSKYWPILAPYSAIHLNLHSFFSKQILTKLLHLCSRLEGVGVLTAAFRSSVDRLIFLGALAGFKEICICGVDLKTSDYFWENGSGERPTVLLDQIDSAHSSNVKDQSGYTALRGIKEMCELTERNFGIRVYKGHSTQDALHFLHTMPKFSDILCCEKSK